MATDLQSPLAPSAASPPPANTAGNTAVRGKIVPSAEVIPLQAQGIPVSNMRPLLGPPDPTEKPEVPEVDLSNIVESINDFLQSARRDLAFSFDEDSGRSIIKVLDRESQEVIRVIPPKEVLAVAAAIREQGILNSVGIRDKA
jgi:flagellar protein FlaG